jgi:acetate kinase
MTPLILVANAGSSSLKFALFKKNEAEICLQAAWLGLELDAAGNERQGPCLSTPASKVTAWVLPTDEDLIIARHTLQGAMRSPDSGGLAASQNPHR